MDTVKWERWKLRFETISAPLGSLAIVVAGVWALSTYVLQREGVWNVDMSVSSTQIPYGNGRALLVLTVGLDNRGRRKVRPDTNGLRLSVIRIPDTLHAPLVWRTGGAVDGGTTVLNRYNMLGHYGSEYEIEPGAHYAETEALVVESPGVFLVTLQLFGPDHDYITQYYYVDTAPGASAPTPASPAATRHR